jgi:tetratricopeptide (TPR) repeat protein
MKTPCTAVNVMQRELIGSERPEASGASTRMTRGWKELMSYRGMTAASAVRVAAALIALAAAAHGRSGPEEWVERVRQANALAAAGSLDRAREMYESALREAQKDGDPLRAGAVWYNLGRLQEHAGRLLEAEQAFRAAAAALSGKPVADAGLLARCHVGLSTVYLRRGEYAKAEAVIRKTLEGGMQVLDPDRAALQGNLALILALRGRAGEAAQLWREIVQWSEMHAAEEVREAGAVAAASLAGLQMRAAETEEAVQNFRRALRLLETVSSPAPTTLAAVLSESAQAMEAQGDWHAAEKMHLQAMAVAEQQLGPGHEVRVRVYERFARFLRERGEDRRGRELAATARREKEEWRRANLMGHVVDFGAWAATLQEGRDAGQKPAGRVQGAKSWRAQ